MATRGFDINIEEVFVSLRRAWYPPSAAVQTSFTRLTQTLGGIFRALQADPDLAELHSEIYHDFPGLPDAITGAAEQRSAPQSSRGGPSPGSDDMHAASLAERRRKGFYLCNSLIQLMEDVYLDLRLEEEHRHPDNRGWMNLFRYWSRSDTFRMTWAVSVSTYGLRFQNFCNRHLSLSIGVTDLKSVWDRVYSPGKNHQTALDAPEAEDFDHTEKRLIEMLTSDTVRGVDNLIKDRVEQVLVARLLVPSSRTAEIQEIGHRALTPEERNDLLSLNFGIVAITGSIKDKKGALLTLAVRRHLRDQGLGRRLMHDLVHRLGVRDVQPPSAEEMRRIGLPSGGRDSVIDLFRSVVNEIDLGEMRRQEAPAEQAREGPKQSRPGAIFDLVPPLPYSGVVRPPCVTWAHAVGFCFWVLAGAGGIEEAEQEATKEALSHWAGKKVDTKETQSIAIESRAWYDSAKRPVEALEPEIDTIIDHLREQSWFRADDRYSTRLGKGLDQIADAYEESKTEVSDFERYLVDKIRKRLGLKPR